LLLPHPFQKRAERRPPTKGQSKWTRFYFNIDYRSYSKPLPADDLYFSPVPPGRSGQGWTSQWTSNGTGGPKENLSGEDNYVWMEAKGRGHFVGVTMSVLQNQDGWWGEGDDMFLSMARPLLINGTDQKTTFSSLGFR